LNFRSFFPTLVTRPSPAVVMPLPALPERIVRNFQMRNSLPFLPTLIWLNRTGAPSSKIITRATPAKTGKSSRSPAAEHVASKSLSKLSDRFIPGALLMTHRVRSFHLRSFDYVLVHPASFALQKASGGQESDLAVECVGRLVSIGVGG
jgi:hypothetical protein